MSRRLHGAVRFERVEAQRTDSDPSRTTAMAIWEPRRIGPAPTPVPAVRHPVRWTSGGKPSQFGPSNREGRG